MKEIVFRIALTEYSGIDELPVTEQKLLQKAREAAKDAYSPYSGFKVGSAVLLENGQTITGNNQENAAYPSGLCAERTALFYASAQFPNVPVSMIAVSALKQELLVDNTVKPCGSCRQVMAEFEDRFEKPIRIILDGHDRIEVLDGIDNLLPLRFRKEALD
ncbi:cytidine deaminase [Prolixibacter bellariivorans]|uniref:Cytidine deaminase n=1 Tax=Prolixibacter bellariivorans TaxID=314319 RepID=A0A5M4AWR2_9BACT|nr:cytidine deaminase [Prolixibacter bellariivorans]GET32204.1 cytidine deaminase [Prolixibacter bellariivorans]